MLTATARPGIGLTKTRQQPISNERPRTTTQPEKTPASEKAPVAVPEVQTDNDDRYRRIKRELHEQLVRSLDMNLAATLDQSEIVAEIRRGIAELCEQRNEILNASQRERLVEEIVDESFGYGPLETLLRDKGISDILINGPHNIYVEKSGKLETSDVRFDDEAHLVRIVQRICSKVGRVVDESNPMVDARLEDGSRLNAIIAPIALSGTSVSIRRFGAQPLMAEDLIKYKSIAPEMVDFMSAAVNARMNVIVSGGTGSGKTTLLNMLSGYISEDERVCTIEDCAELRLQQSHVVSLETRPKNIEGRGEVTSRDLVKNALRMRPDRVVIGECRGGEALDMLQAMNTGHEGSLTTLHANNAREAISRLEMMAAMSDMELPIWIIRRQIVSAVDLVIQASRLRGGARKIVSISEVVGMEGDTVLMQDLFKFNQTGVDDDGVAEGQFECCGIRPKCLDKIASMGTNIDPAMFERRVLEW
jgi:pilus assembly protein CpaF